MKTFGSREVTRMMFGIVSKVGDKHFFLGDFDGCTEKQLMRRVGEILFDKYKFGKVYLIRSGKGLHLLNFTEKLNLEEYIKILEEMGADPKFIRILEFNKFGVLRFSKKDCVPFLVKVLFSPYKKDEDLFYRNLYFSFLELEEEYEPVWVEIHGNKKS